MKFPVISPIQQFLIKTFKPQRSKMSKGRLSLATINKNVKAAQYAVRGPIVNRSMELAQKMKKDPSSVPFKKIIACNIGKPQSLEQKPLTFMRDVLSLTLNPSLKDKATFAADVVKRA